MTKTLPTMRERNRYMVLEVMADDKFVKDDIVRTIWNSSVRLLGESGFSKTGLWLVEWDEGKQKGILRASHKTVPQVRASLALIKEICNKPALLHVLGVSGTIKGAKAKWM